MEFQNDVIFVSRRFTSPRRAAWSAIFFFQLALLVFASWQYYFQIMRVQPILENLPVAVQASMTSELRFERLESDISHVNKAALDGLAVCEISAKPLDCDAIQSDPDVSASQRNTVTQIAQVLDSFNSSLTVIWKSATDKYFGTEELQLLVDNLNIISDTLLKLKPIALTCSFTNKLYCEMEKASASILANVDGMRDEMYSFTSHDIVVMLSQRANVAWYLKWGYIPASMSCFFYTLFWSSGFAMCGTPIGNLTIMISGLFWLMSFSVSLTLVISWLIILRFSDEYKLKSFAGSPTVVQLLAHIETDFNEFYNAVIPELFQGLTNAYNACVVFHFMCHMHFWYAVFVQLCKPYEDLTWTGNDNDNENDQGHHRKSAHGRKSHAPRKTQMRMTRKTRRTQKVNAQRKTGVEENESNVVDRIGLTTYGQWECRPCKEILQRLQDLIDRNRERRKSGESQDEDDPEERDGLTKQ